MNESTELQRLNELLIKICKRERTIVLIRLTEKQSFRRDLDSEKGRIVDSIPSKVNLSLTCSDANPVQSCRMYDYFNLAQHNVETIRPNQTRNRTDPS